MINPSFNNAERNEWGDIVFEGEGVFTAERPVSGRPGGLTLSRLDDKEIRNSRN